jgi:DNA polymerase elongation subunit (family B)
MISLPYNNILFIDIETVSQRSSFNELSDDWKKLWEAKSQFLIRNRPEETPETIYDRAAIYAEFGKIICISCGCINGKGADKKIILKSFYGHDEKTVLTEFLLMLDKWFAEPGRVLCAHNGKEFDFPYICRRLLINHLRIPDGINSTGKKPWEVGHYDTMELWKFGDFKNYTSLNLLANTLGIPTPKDDIDGSQVGNVYWRENDLPRIVSYCQKDVLTVAQVLLRMNGESLINSSNIEIKL